MSAIDEWAAPRIWLQREQGEGGSHTWCEESVGDGDLIEEAEYVRADLVADMAEAMKFIVGAIRLRSGERSVIEAALLKVGCLGDQQTCKEKR